MRMGNLVKCKFLFWELNAASISWCLHFKTQKGDQHENILVLQNSCSGTGILGVLELDQYEDGMHAGHNFLKWSNIEPWLAPFPSYFTAFLQRKWKLQDFQDFLLFLTTYI